MDVGRVSAKKVVLMTAALVLMFVSWFGDGELADEGTREILREELEKMNEN